MWSGNKKIVVSKGNYREFIQLCVDVSACKTTEEIKPLYEVGLQKGIFEVVFVYSEGPGSGVDWHVNDENNNTTAANTFFSSTDMGGTSKVSSMLDKIDQVISLPNAKGNSDLALELAESYGNSICELVQNIAKFLTAGEDFWLLRDNGVTATSSRNRVVTLLGRPYLFFPDQEQCPSFEEKSGKYEECIRDEFTDAFLDVLEAYMKKRNIKWHQLPIRFCNYCGIPFFGSRHDQRFCSTRHGQRWHAEKSNAEKRG